MVQQQYAARHDEPSRDTPEQALGQAEVEEGAADEGIGCADELGNLDLVASRQYLKADSVEGYGDEGEAEQSRQDGDRQSAEAQDCL